jgi:hypothetical protein
MLQDLVLGNVPNRLRLLSLQLHPASCALLPWFKCRSLLLLSADCLRDLLTLLMRCRPLMQLVVGVYLEGPEASQRVVVVIFELVGFLLALGRLRQNLS